MSWIDNAGYLYFVLITLSWSLGTTFRKTMEIIDVKIARTKLQIPVLVLSSKY